MLGGAVNVPVVFRMPTGSGLGGAAQHSQSIEAWFAHVPGPESGRAVDAIRCQRHAARGDRRPRSGDRVRAQAALQDQGPGAGRRLSRRARPRGGAPRRERSDDRRVGDDASARARSRGDAGRGGRRGRSYRSSLAAAARRARRSSPASRRRRGCSRSTKGSRRSASAPRSRALVAESEAFDYLDAPIMRLGGAEAPIPYSPALEKAAVPQVEDIVAAARRLARALGRGRATVAVESFMPRVDMDMGRARSGRWHAAEGERVREGATLFEIETDKAAMEVEAPASGLLRTLRLRRAMCCRSARASPGSSPRARCFAPPAKAEAGIASAPRLGRSLRRRRVKRLQR